MEGSGERIRPSGFHMSQPAGEAAGMDDPYDMDDPLRIISSASSQIGAMPVPKRPDFDELHLEIDVPPMPDGGGGALNKDGATELCTSDSGPLLGDAILS